MKGFTTPSQLLEKYAPSDRDKYISQEFQKYAYDLAQELNDSTHIALYMRLAKTQPRARLETARNFVKDAANVKSKPKLFLWKLGQLKTQKKAADQKLN